MKSIAFGGQMRVGKDVSADYLALKLGTVWKRAAFGANVKRVFKDSFGVDDEFIEKWKVSPEIPEGFNTTIRKSLQKIGDGFRDIKSTIWMDFVFRENKNSIISDVRYYNELFSVNDHYGCNILIWRPGMENDDPSPSESEMGDLVTKFVSWGMPEGPVNKNLISNEMSCLLEAARKVDYFLINDGTIQDLYNKIDFHLIPFLNSFFRDKVQV